MTLLSIAQYNTEQPVPFNYWPILARSLTVRGFISPECKDRFGEGIEQMDTWVADDQLVFAEDVVDGLENTLAIFSRLSTGINKGRLMVKVCDPSEPAPTVEGIRTAAGESAHV